MCAYAARSASRIAGQGSTKREGLTRLVLGGGVIFSLLFRRGRRHSDPAR